jgi:peptidoglycan/xylan/chitin deacetylase (PgdA/CDA1 family)
MVTGDRYRPSAFVSVSAAMHMLALGWIAFKPAVWPFAVGALIADHAGLVLGGLFPRCRILGPNMTRMRTNENGQRVVALTFDDGPHPELTPRVLDVLDDFGARASFFCVGREIEQQAPLVREMVSRGHQIENHTWSHPNWFALLSPAGLTTQISRTQSVIDHVTGRAPTYFRAPAGIRSPWLDPVLQRYRLRLVSWTRRGFDTVDKDPDRIYFRLVSNIAPGDILLLHDGGPRDTSLRSALVLELLPRLLDKIRRKGLQVVPLS